MKVSIIMGSTSDYEVMSGAEQMLKQFGVEYETRVISAHRTPDLMFEYSKSLKDRGFGVVIAGAGGAAHLAGVAAGLTTLPVIAVPMATKNLGGLDSLLSMVQMPTACRHCRNRRSKECRHPGSGDPCLGRQGAFGQARRLSPRAGRQDQEHHRLAGNTL